MSQTYIYSLLFILAAIFLAPTVSLAQACGCGDTHIVVGNKEGEAIAGVIVEIIDPKTGRPSPMCDRSSLAVQIGTGKKFRFTFSSWETGRDTVVLRVSADGYNTYEQRGRFLSGCRLMIEVTLWKNNE